MWCGVLRVVAVNGRSERNVVRGIRCGGCEASAVHSIIWPECNLVNILLILKPAAPAQVLKTELFVNSFRYRASTCVTKIKEHNFGKQPTVDSSP